MMSGDTGVLEYVFYCIGRCSFDRAKEISEKEEKAAGKNPQGSVLALSQLMASLGQLSAAEKMYFSLSFLTQTPNNPKAFRRKDARIPLQGMYGQIKQDLDRRLEILYRTPDTLGTESSSGFSFTAPSPTPSTSSIPTSGPAGQIPSAVVVHLSEQLSHFTTARLDMIEIYEQLHEMGLNRVGQYGSLLTKIEQVMTTYGKEFHHPALSPLESSFSLETEVLKHLISAQLRMLDWNFMASLVHLTHAHRRLQMWTSIQQAEERPAQLPGYRTSPTKTTTWPALLTWFSKYQTALLAKFSLYFHDVLSKQTTLPDLRNLMTKTVPDYHQKILQFQRKSDAHSVCVVLDTNGMDYRGAGYQLPGHQPEAPSGLNSYPLLFCYPPEKPAKHWAPIVMTLAEESRRLAEPDNIVTVSDRAMDRTYFAAQIEPRFYIVIVFEVKKSEKDVTVTQFLLDIVSQLRCSKTLESLKPAQ
ncbi:hypothetical protein RvY_08699 [Ramazzottius varieornatus]|uniref:KICSTOR subunit 2 n=1 Tax=Ramazzottius varieornatus TaxID=947166 RepID=A0A1D1VBE7_RAMVA|nr:hypothetical protein RvY_08699 [Ramazzottius varieornatus]